MCIILVPARQDQQTEQSLHKQRAACRGRRSGHLIRAFKLASIHGAAKHSTTRQAAPKTTPNPARKTTPKNTKPSKRGHPAAEPYHVHTHIHTYVCQYRNVYTYLNPHRLKHLIYPIAYTYTSMYTYTYAYTYTCTSYICMYRHTPLMA